MVDEQMTNPVKRASAALSHLFPVHLPPMDQPVDSKQPSVKTGEVVATGGCSGHVVSAVDRSRASRQRALDEMTARDQALGLQ